MSGNQQHAVWILVMLFVYAGTGAIKTDGVLSIGLSFFSGCCLATVAVLVIPG